jgi:uncharacterized protein
MRARSGCRLFGSSAPLRLVPRSAACALILVAGAALAASYRGDTEKWRADYEAGLKAPQGWLSVAGLFWLHEGENVVGSGPRSDVVLPAGTPGRAGVLEFHAGEVTFRPANGPPARLKPDTPGPADVVHIGSVAMTIIKRGPKTGVRLRDPNAPTRLHFTGCRWFPIDETWHVRAKWVAYPQPKAIAIANILGMTDQEPSPGYAEFTLLGKTLRLEPVTEDDHLFFMLKDLTAGRTTYGAGRFLYAAMPRDGVVELDFNRAENPPCAFTAFATCPLPPKQSWLPISIEAGEKKYGNH